MARYQTFGVVPVAGELTGTVDESGHGKTYTPLSSPSVR